MKEDKNVLVLGESGQVAKAIKELNHPLKNFKNFIFLSRKDIDFSVNIQNKFTNLIKFHKPCLVINTIAYTAVDKAEDDIETAMLVNGYSLHTISKICGIKKIPLFHLSTDYVFDGNKASKWLPDDPTRPLGIYGLSKLFGELFVKNNIENFGTKAIILRVSWVFSNKGNNFVKTILNLAKVKEEISIVNDQIGSPTSAKSIANALIDIIDCAINNTHPIKGEKDNFPWGIYHFQGLPNVTWYSFGKEIVNQGVKFNLLERKVKIKPIKTLEYPTICKRPTNTCLDCSSTSSNLGINMPSWKEDLTLVINDLFLKSN